MNRKVLLKGEVGYVDIDAGAIILKCPDLESGKMEVLHITVPSNVEFKGLASLFDLEVGDEVLVNVYENDVSGVLKARAITR